CATTDFRRCSMPKPTAQASSGARPKARSRPASKPSGKTQSGTRSKAQSNAQAESSARALARAYGGTAATQFLHHSQPFRFRRGGSLPQIDLAYETWGMLNSDRTNAVMILTGISPSAHAASSKLDPGEGWWEPMIGPGCPLD